MEHSCVNRYGIVACSLSVDAPRYHVYEVSLGESALAAKGTLIVPMDDKDEPCVFVAATYPKPWPLTRRQVASELRMYRKDGTVRRVQ